jgi:hypothetical protein
MKRRIPMKVVTWVGAGKRGQILEQGNSEILPVSVDKVANTDKGTRKSSRRH